MWGLSLAPRGASPPPDFFFLPSYLVRSENLSLCHIPAVILFKSHVEFVGVQDDLKVIQVNWWGQVG